MKIIKQCVFSYSISLRAYTIIEVLLVVVVIATMSLVSVQFLSNRAREAKIQVAVSEINQYSQAGLSYFHTNDKWPLRTELVATYLPQLQNKRNPWGNIYNTDRTAEKEGAFEVNTVVPDRIIADRLVAALPAAKATVVSGGFQVSAYVGAAVPDPTNKVTIEAFGHGNSPYNSLGKYPTKENNPAADLSFLQDQDEYDENAGIPTSTMQELMKKVSAIQQSIIIKKPICQAGYTPDYKAILTGYQKSCYLRPGSINQCDDDCPTKNIYCTDPDLGLDNPLTLYDAIHISYPNKHRYKDDACCVKDTLEMFFFTQRCDVVSENVTRWKCKTYGALSDPWYIPPFTASAAILDGIMKNDTGMEKSVNIEQIDETANDWKLLVRTDMTRPHGLVDWYGYFFDKTHVFDNWNGEVTYFTFCRK